MSGAPFTRRAGPDTPLSPAFLGDSLPGLHNLAEHVAQRTPHDLFSVSRRKSVALRRLSTLARRTAVTTVATVAIARWADADVGGRKLS